MEGVWDSSALASPSGVPIPSQGSYPDPPPKVQIVKLFLPAICNENVFFRF